MSVNEYRCRCICICICLYPFFLHIHILSKVCSRTVRKLEVNEVLEAFGREPQSGLVRVECKAKDGAKGFVTVAGLAGTTYLEVYTPFMACVRKAEEALADSYESVCQTVAYLEQKHDELRSTRGAPALQDLKEQLQNLRARIACAQVSHSDVRNKLAEAKNRHERLLEALKKKRQQAQKKITGFICSRHRKVSVSLCRWVMFGLTRGEASSTVDGRIAKADRMAALNETEGCPHVAPEQPRFSGLPARPVQSQCLH
ncbi:unnamed protein product [Symbiodinium sp. CCMP2592]|nr:unnamed protein product [Symbiodinium sp. CCMP2592]